MKKNYIVIETETPKGTQFMHFVSLKEDLEEDLKSLFHHLYYFENQVITKIRFAEERLRN